MRVLTGIGPLGCLYEALFTRLQYHAGAPYGQAVCWVLLGAWVLHLAWSVGLTLWAGYCLTTRAGAWMRGVVLPPTRRKKHKCRRLRGVARGAA